LAGAQSATDSLLNKLNTVLANKEEYVKKKQADISQLNQLLSRARTLKEKYVLSDSLYEQYKSFSYDSAYSYAKKLQETAIALKDPFLIASAKMKLAFTLLSSGLFKEKLESINPASLPVEDRVQFYFLIARCYFDLSDYNRTADYSALYDPKGIKYIDSALVLCQPGTYISLRFSKR